jgi:hypothetical protein
VSKINEILKKLDSPSGKDQKNAVRELKEQNLYDEFFAGCELTETGEIVADVPWAWSEDLLGYFLSNTAFLSASWAWWWISLLLMTYCLFFFNRFNE